MIYFCIPCHNEERTVGIVLWKIRQVMADFPRDYQILVADDASSDKSYDVLEPYSRVLPLTLLRQTDRRGYAATLEMLLREVVRRSAYPKRDIIVVMQADFTDDPEHAVALLKRLESGADIAVPDPTAASQPGFVRGLADRFAKQFALRRKWPPEVKDPLHGFLAIRLFCAQKAFEAQSGRLLAWEGRAANAALLHAVLPFARRIDAVEVTTHPERLQRTSRFAAMAFLGNAWRFARDVRPASLLAVDRLVPDQVHGDRAALRTSMPNRTGDQAPDRVANGQRRARSGRTGQTERSAREPGDRDQRTGQRPRKRSDGSVRPERAAAPVLEAAATTDSASQPKRRRGGRGRRNSENRQPRPEDRPNDASEMSPVVDDGEPAASVENAENQPAIEGAEPQKRRSRGSRGRRGGRGRRPRPESAGEPADASQGSTPEAFTPGDDKPAAADSEGGAGEDSDSQEASGRKRRRGRRGGRRHRGSRTRGDGTLGAPEGAPAAESDSAPAAAGQSGTRDD